MSDLNNVEYATIWVKNVYDREESHELKLDISQTILELKNILKHKLKSQPVVSEQRLIYCGKVCDDSSKLSDILTRMDLSCTQIFHILISKKGASPVPSRKLPTNNIEDVSLANESGVIGADISQSSTSASTPTSESISASIPQDPHISNDHFNGTSPPQDGHTSSPHHPYMNSYLSWMHHLSEADQALLSQANLPLDHPHYRYQQFLFHEAARITHGFYVAHDPVRASFLHQMYGMEAQIPLQAGPISGAATPFSYMYPHGIPQQGVNTHSSEPSVNQTPATNTATGVNDNNANRQPNANVNNMFRSWWNGIIQFADIKLAVKLIIAVIIIGQDASPVKFWTVVISAVISYLWITGLLGRIGRVFYSPHVPDQQAQNGQARPTPGRAGGAVSNMTNVHIVPDGGILKDVQYLVIGFVLSLVPSWKPQAPVQLQPPVIPPNAPQ